MHSPKGVRDLAVAVDLLHGDVGAPPGPGRGEHQQEEEQHLQQINFHLIQPEINALQCFTLPINYLFTINKKPKNNETLGQLCHVVLSSF